MALPLPINFRRVAYRYLVLVITQLIGSTSLSADESELKLGAIFSLTGYGAEAGNSELAAVRMAVEDINEMGGIEDHQLKLIAEDNKSSRPDTASAFNKLVGIDHVSFVFGPNWAEFAEVAAPIAERSRTIMITASGYSKSVTKNRQYVFNLWPSFKAQTEPFAKYIVRRGHRKIAILQSTNTYFEGIAEALDKQLTDAGQPIWKRFNVPPDSHDFRSVIVSMFHQQVDAVIFLLMEGGENTAFLRQLKELGVTMALYGGPGIPYESQLQGNLKLAEGVIYFYFETPTDDRFIKRFRARYPKIDPIPSTARAYDSVFILRDALEKCGLDPHLALPCLNAIDFPGVSGHIRLNDAKEVISFQSLTSLFRIRKGVKEMLP